MKDARMLPEFVDSTDPILAFAAANALGQKPSAAKRKAALADPRTQALMARASAWSSTSIASHKSAQQPFHALSFLSEIGFTRNDGALGEIAEEIVESMGEDGVPRFPSRTSEAHGGSGKEVRAWALCDAPTVLYSLSRLGVPAKKLTKGIGTIAGLSFESGWPCAVSPELGSWRGPGKKGDPCPYATLVSLKLLLEEPEKWETEIERGKECLLRLWQRSREEHPFIFYMGTDFRKPKLPWLWYDIVHVAEVLSRCAGIGADKRFKDMLGVLEAQAASTLFIPASVYLPFKDWDFGQKKKPSEWLAFAYARVKARLAP